MNALNICRGMDTRGDRRKAGNQYTQLLLANRLFSIILSAYNSYRRSTQNLVTYLIKHYLRWTDKQCVCVYQCMWYCLPCFIIHHCTRHCRWITYSLYERYACSILHTVCSVHPSLHTHAPFWECNGLLYLCFSRFN